MESLRTLIVNFLNMWQVQTIFILIAADFVFGFAKAIKLREFDWRKLVNFYLTNFVPYVLVYLGAYLLATLPEQAELGQVATIIAWLLENSWLVVMYKIGASIVENVKALGYEVPE